MTLPASDCRIDVVAAPVSAVDTDLLIIPAFEEDDLSDVPGLDDATGGEIARALVTREVRGKAYEVFLTPVTQTGWRPRRLAVVGAGSPVDYGTDRVRKVASAAGLAARDRRITRVAFLARVPPRRADAIEPTSLARAAAEGLTLARFNAGRYKTGDQPPADFGVLTIVLAQTAEAQPRASEAVRRGCFLAECSNLARGLANEPGGALPPRCLADRAVEIAGGAGVQVEVLDEQGIEALGMGLLLAVGRGSQEPPRLIVMRHDPPGANDRPVLGLVGKGITFDTGGISIKPADGMERMKDDMAGGAAVICAMRAIALLDAPIRVIGIVPSAENMPSGAALKPGDVVRSASGKTVEVINTDAEGRLVLADGLWYAQQLGATHLVDIATLTGACVVALGKLTSGLFGRPPDWVDQVRAVADSVGDRSWPLPVFEDYREALRSEVADLVNSAGRPAGAITAAMFLKEFAGDRPWVHMDVAGTAWSDEPRPYLPKGASGVGVRTLAELPFTAADWKV